jgi:hypothetical protein
MRSPPYAPLDLRVLQAVAAVAPLVEIGAGDGAWARALRSLGAYVLAFDREPRGAGVEAGDHAVAQRRAPERAGLLMVWPPDGAVAAAWIKGRRWPHIAVVACWSRLDLAVALEPYDLASTLELPKGRKGASQLRMLTLRTGLLPAAP